MRAAVVREPGTTTAIEFIDTATPDVGPGDIRIKVAAAGVNPIDLYTRNGFLHEAGALERGVQTGLGWEVAGVVDAVGAEVTDFAVGDRVAALTTTMTAPIAGYADYLVVEAKGAAHIPDDLAFAPASVLPVSALTADQAIALSGVKQGDSLLVTGAAGMVGGFTVQLAARQGVKVIAVASKSDEPVLREWGADLVIDRDTDVAAAVKNIYPDGADAAIDAAIIVEPALAAVRAGGKYVGVRPMDVPTSDVVDVVSVWVEQDSARLAELARTDLDIRVAQTLPLTDARLAHEIAEKGGVRGRIVLEP
ncbi:MAG: NADP-dependent oxidoreductase [Rhodococcus sp.]|nr:NADP-dependent oxidoreductase [Rhodococcus sp. (in: high G+C Gram-positive bacteria)]